MNKQTQPFEPSIPENLQDYTKSTTLLITMVYFITTICIVGFLGMKVHLITMPLVLAIIVFLYPKVLSHDLCAFKDHLKQYVLFTLLFFVANFFLASIVGSFITSTILNALSKAGMELSSPNQQTLTRIVKEMRFVSFLSIVIVGPILEEFMFRRCLKVLLPNKVVYYFLTSILFGLVHLMIGFTFPLSFVYIFTYFFSGLVFAYAYDKTNNIWVSIFAHMLNNALGYVVMMQS